MRLLGRVAVGELRLHRVMRFTLSITRPFVRHSPLLQLDADDTFAVESRALSRLGEPELAWRSSRPQPAPSAFD